MEEKDIIEKNIAILEKLANGINPIDNTMLPEDSIINDIEITRALYFAVTKLKFEPKATSKKKYFYIEEERLKDFEFVQDGAFLTQIVQKLNQLVDLTKYKKLSRNKMVKWLVNIGILTTVQLGERKASRHMPTQQGLDMGLEVVHLTDRYGNAFSAVKYPVSMQKFILDNIESFYNWATNGKG